MKLDKESRKLSRHLYRSSLVDGKLERSRVSGVVDSLLAAKPRNYMAILKDYQRQIRNETNRRHAVIESATDLMEPTTRKVLQDLEARYGADLTTEFRVNPDLLGGLRIKIGDDVYDGSVRNRLERLKEELTHP